MDSEMLAMNVQRLVDIEEIRNLHLGYVYALNSLQWDAMLACFTEDAVTDLWDHGLCQGKAAIEKQFKGDLATIVDPKDGHFIGQPIIHVDGDRADGQWMMYIFFPDSEPRFVKGKYDAEYTRTGSGWRISRLTYTCPWPAP